LNAIAALFFKKKYKNKRGVAVSGDKGQDRCKNFTEGRKG